MAIGQSKKILVTMQEIVDYTGRNKKTVEGLIAAHNFPAIKDQGRWTANTDLIDRWYERRIEAQTCGGI